MCYIKCRRQCINVILLLFVTLVQSNCTSSDVQNINIGRSMKIDFDGTRKELLAIIDRMDSLLVEIGRIVGSTGVVAVTDEGEVKDVGSSDNTELIDEVKEKYKEIVSNITDVLQEVIDDQMDIIDSKTKIDVLEDEIMKFYRKFDNAYTQGDKKLTELANLLQSVITAYKDLVKSTLKKMEEMEKEDQRLQAESDNKFLEAMDRSDYELAAVTIMAVQEESRVLKLLDAAYQKMKAIDGLLYLASRVRDLHRRTFIYTRSFEIVTSHKIKDGCELVKMIYMLDKDIMDLLTRSTKIFENIYLLSGRVKSKLLLFVQGDATRSLGSGVTVRNDAAYLTFEIRSEYKTLLQRYEYTVGPDSSKRGAIRCSGFKVAI